MKILLLLVCLISVFSLPLATKNSPHYSAYKQNNLIAAVELIDKSVVDIFLLKKDYSKLYTFHIPSDRIYVDIDRPSESFCAAIISKDDLRAYKRNPDKFDCLKLPARIDVNEDTYLVVHTSDAGVTEYRLSFSVPLMRTLTTQSSRLKTTNTPNTRQSFKKTVEDIIFYVPRTIGYGLARLTLFAFKLLNITPVRDALSTTLAMVAIYILVVASLAVGFVLLAVPDPHEIKSFSRALSLSLLFPLGAHCLYLERYGEFLAFISNSFLVFSILHGEVKNREILLTLSVITYIVLYVRSVFKMPSWTHSANIRVKKAHSTECRNDYYCFQ